MLRICFLLAFVMSAAMAFPQDEVLPETSATLSQLSENHPELKHATPKDAAHAKIKMMQAQGFDNTQCKQLATDAITGMTSALKAEQDTMTALSTGADCLVTTPATRRLLGIAAQQQLLDDAAAALVIAKTDLATKETALATASSAPVSITMTLDTIGTNMAAIGQAVSLDSAVVSAKAAVVTAQAVKDAATLVVVADQASFDTASTAAQDASQECLCNAKAAHDTAWPNAQKVVTDNTQAWKEAHHVKCALDGTADDACSVPAFTVTNTVLVTEAANVVCTEAPTPAPTPAPLQYHKVFDGECGGAETRKYYHAITNDANPGTTVAERVKYCAEACDGFNVPQDLNRRGLPGGTTGGVAKGFAVTPNEGVCWCEPQDSSTCTRTMDPTRDAANTGYDRYDFGSSATCDTPLANAASLCHAQLHRAGKTDHYGSANSLGFTIAEFLPYCQQKCATGRAGEVCSAILMPQARTGLTCSVYYGDSVLTCGTRRGDATFEMHMNCHLPAPTEAPTPAPTPVPYNGDESNACVTNGFAGQTSGQRTPAGRQCTGWYGATNQAGGPSDPDYGYCQGTDRGGHGWCGTSAPNSGRHDWGGCSAACASVPRFNN